MITRKAIATLTMCTLSVLSIPNVLNLNKVEAQPVTDYREKTPNYRDANCRSFVPGTYLSTATQANSASGQPSSYREIITFTADGNLIANDSTAGGVPGSSNSVEQPFGPIQGTWKCTGNNEIVAKVLNFGFSSGSLPGYIALTEYHLTFNPTTGIVDGDLMYNLFDLDSNPLDQNTQALPGGPYTFSYSGEKLTVNED